LAYLYIILKTNDQYDSNNDYICKQLKGFMRRKEIIEQKLSVLNPHILNILNESAKHFGHSGNPDNDDETHFAIEICAQKLNNLSKIDQHRCINNLLKEEFTKGLHALSIKVITKI
jgi:BolA protein